jgi:hypothetical protein
MAETAELPMSRRILVAATSAGAAAIHFAVAPVHATEYVPLAMAFVLAGWAQAAAAVGILVRPTRQVRLAVAAVSALCIAAWVMSRSVGLPLGPEAWAAEPVGSADLLAVAFAAVALVGAIVPARAAAPLAGSLGVGRALAHGDGVADDRGAGQPVARRAPPW